MISKNNIRPFIGSIIVAVVLWLIVAMQKDYSYNVQVPINIVRIAEGKVLANKIPEAALIEFNGKGSAILGMLFYNVSLNLELPELRSTQRINLSDYLNFLDLPSTFGLQTGEIIEPKSIELVVDEYTTETKAILLSGSVGTENGYTLMGYTLTPDTARISGPKSVIAKQDYIFTEMLEFVKQKMNFKIQVSLQNPKPGITFVDPAQIEAQFDIQQLIERVIYDIPIQVINAPNNLSVEAVPNKLSLKVKGGEILVAQLKPHDFNAQIDYAKHYQVEKQDYGASITTPENISWIESIPTTFKLKVRRKSRPNG